MQGYLISCNTHARPEALGHYGHKRGQKLKQHQQSCYSQQKNFPGHTQCATPSIYAIYNFSLLRHASQTPLGVGQSIQKLSQLDAAISQIPCSQTKEGGRSHGLTTPNSSMVSQAREEASGHCTTTPSDRHQHHTVAGSKSFRRAPKMMSQHQHTNNITPKTAQYTPSTTRDTACNGISAAGKKGKPSPVCHF